MKKIVFEDTKLAPLITHSSKGDQPKWKYRNRWYKIDEFGYESLAEVVISRLLIGKFDVLTYSPIQIEYNGEVKMGTVSDNFLNKGDELYTLERLHLIFCGEGLADKLDKITSTEERIRYTVGFIGDITGIDNVGDTLTAWLELDAKFLNEDRHTNNIAFIRDREYKWRFAPYFDNGLSLLSDVQTYPPTISNGINKRKVKAKPFSTDFNKQVKAAEKLYDKQLDLTFTLNEVDSALYDLNNYYDSKYIDRIKRIIVDF